MPDLFVSNEGKKPTPTLVEPSSLQKPIPKTPTNLLAEEQFTHSPMNPMASFCLHPGGVTVENQEADEHIILFLRRAPVLGLPRRIFISLLLLLPIVVAAFWPVLSPAFIPIPQNVLIVLTVFYYLIVIGYAFINFVIWYYNVGIITNLRVIDIDVIGISNKNFAATGIEDIVDVEYHQSGFLQSFFDFGSVHMQTEGLKANFEYIGVPKPAKVFDVLSDLIRVVRGEEVGKHGK
jgi:hypothetical protein